MGIFWGEHTNTFDRFLIYHHSDCKDPGHWGNMDGNYGSFEYKDKDTLRKGGPGNCLERPGGLGAVKRMDD